MRLGLLSLLLQTKANIRGRRGPRREKNGMLGVVVRVYSHFVCRRVKRNVYCTVVYNNKYVVQRVLDLLYTVAFLYKHGEKLLYVHFCVRTWKGALLRRNAEENAGGLASGSAHPFYAGLRLKKYKDPDAEVTGSGSASPPTSYSLIAREDFVLDKRLIAITHRPGHRSSASKSAQL